MIRTVFAGRNSIWAGTDGSGLAHLAGLGSLTSLGLSGTNVTDAGLPSLSRLTRLEYLNLEKTRITDAGLVHLAGLTRCRQLVLQHTEVTPAGAAALEKKLPRTQVLITPPWQRDSSGRTGP